ncbi:MAG: cobalamin biosynthesis protein CobD [Rhizobiales bacterium]|nr:cobalamin biosynthesis protein CobD [Hyphomicrobiales bacterium]
MLVALGIDALVGWPRWLYERVGHPVTWIGALISALDRTLNEPARGMARGRAIGLLAALVTIGVATGAAWGLATILPGGWLGVATTGLLAWPFVATRAMHDHVTAVADPLEAGDLPTARRAVSMIVGRDPTQLDAPAVARASLESLAENTSDGIVAPVFWGALLGLPGIVAYKAINTLDSMIGHRTPRHEAFGWASARIDDVVNLAPARLTGLLFVLASGRPAAAFTTMLRDARHHRSPNAGWPEAAMAGALGVRLSGPRVYADRIAEEPWLNGTARDPQATDIRHGLALFRRAMMFLALLLALAVALVIISWRAGS